MSQSTLLFVFTLLLNEVISYEHTNTSVGWKNKSLTVFIAIVYPNVSMGYRQVFRSKLYCTSYSIVLGFSFKANVTHFKICAWIKHVICIVTINRPDA